MFSLGGNEILIIVVVALLLFGPDKIPQLARTINRFMREFNKYRDIMESTIRMEISRADEPEEDKITIEQRIAQASAAGAKLLEEQQTGTAETAEADPPVTPAPVLPAADEADEEDEG